jgi:hypothetical protein
MYAGRNPARVAADQERRRSGAAGVHQDRRTRRRRTRTAALRAAINEQREAMR